VATSQGGLVHEPLPRSCGVPRTVKVPMVLTWAKVWNLRYEGLLDGLHRRPHDPFSGPRTVKVLMVLTSARGGLKAMLGGQQAKPLRTPPLSVVKTTAREGSYGLTSGPSGV